MSELESLSVHEKLARHLERHALDRLVMLCDGVFAIATTLAAVEVHLPDHAASLGDIWAQAGDRILTYVVSFFVIATFWLHNRDLFARLVRVDKVVTALTLLTLCAVALIPASNHIFRSDGPGAASLTFYALLMVICGGINCALWFYAAYLSKLMMPEVSGGFRLKRLVRTAFLPLIFLVLLVVPGTAGLKTAVAVLAGVTVAWRIGAPLLEKRLDGSAAP